MPKRIFLLFYLIAGLCFTGNTQDTNLSSVHLNILTEQQLPLSNATVELSRIRDSSLVKIQMTDSIGTARFIGLSPGDYFFYISKEGYSPQYTSFSLGNNFHLNLSAIQLRPSVGTLATVTVSARRPFIEMQPGKTIVNLDASITNIGTTALEALEKMPGITIDKDGNISLKGRPGVNIMIDGKPTYINSTELNTLLTNMSASQISQVEIIDQPSSRYDAAGNAGVINIKTKKNKQKGFNGSISLTYGQGRYLKNNKSIQLNYHVGKWNLFINYSLNHNYNFLKLYALRTYFEPDGKTISSLLEQPSFIKGRGSSHTSRTGVDYYMNAKTIIGLGFNGLLLDRKSRGNNTALWMNEQRLTDSLIITKSLNTTNWKNAGANMYIRHSFSASRELSADVDILGYRIRGDQFFENTLVFPGSYIEASRADIPSDLRIYSAKADYTEMLKNWKLEGGLKSSYVTTDNFVAHENRVGNQWNPDYGRSNHFKYKENIHAVYTNAETKMKKWTMQGGLRYEMTGYDAHQLGNIIQKDSAFSRNYNSLFPSFFASFTVDSANTLSFNAGRRIDRPAFQKLNPFLFIINKYTYQQGNPFYRPQFTWNFSISHLYKNLLVTSVSYNTTSDYFSQVFLSDSIGTVIYTEGNLGRLQNYGLSVALQLAATSWWSLSVQGVLNYKKMEGMIWKEFRASINQLNINLNNQFHFKKEWSAEISGFYTSRSQNDIQELLDPAGQLSAGLSKTIMKNKATIKLAVRDIFYTNWMKGLSQFQGSTEYFKLTRDTRVLNLSLTWRFGKAFKTSKRLEGAASEEMQRVGNG